MQECIVCFKNEWLTETKCNHIICIECLFKLKKNECPMCRKEFKSTLPKSLWEYLDFTPKEPTYVMNYYDFPPLN